ncbi:MAG: hypothetical protein QOI83_4655 [Streptomycetaceae bacterium]|nr:hypothetical protein [Streptomycetaceae bacterium]
MRRTVQRRRMRLRSRFWRWRRNPLRRRSDLAEAWAGLLAAVVIAVGAPAAGWATGAAVTGALQRTVRAQRTERAYVPAVVLKAGPREVTGTDPESGTLREEGRAATARWTGPDGKQHSGTVRIAVDQAKGDRIYVWTDPHGDATTPPLDAATATAHAAMAGLGTALLALVLGTIGRQTLMWQLLRRRLAEWEREWAAAGQDWGRADAGG